jgi:acetolactate synthase-like protein
MTIDRHGGTVAADVLASHGVPHLFTLCGGHISPILVAARAAGIRIIDVRHEATAVFAADATARLSGIPGVAVVTAGPGVTNTVTAVKNAQMAQSPVVLIGGATPTLLKGRGSLQDIDQMALMRPHVKWARTVRQVKEIAPTLERAFQVAQSDVPGPVFIEIPVDLLYPEELVRGWYAEATPKGSSLSGRATRWYINRHVNRLFAGTEVAQAGEPLPVNTPQFTEAEMAKTAVFLQKANKPLLIIGSQALLQADQTEALQAALIELGIPTYLSGMARGLLGLHPLHIRHKRSQALKEADLVLLAGVPQDFRLNYGRSIPRHTPIISINRSPLDMTLNRKPTLGILADPGHFLRQLAGQVNRRDRWQDWHTQLQARDAARNTEIDRLAQASTTAQAETHYLNPVSLCQQIEAALDENSVIIGDGGDFVATASYIVRPRGPLRWLDPGPFGTLGAGAGFALGAKLCYPEAEVWLLYGDGSAGYTLSEFDTFHRHDLPVIAVVGNDGVWAQIAREQVAIFDDDVATCLGHADYDAVAAGFGAQGFHLSRPAAVSTCLHEAKKYVRNGRSVLINALIGQTDFRQGSISM